MTPVFLKHVSVAVIPAGQYLNTGAGDQRVLARTADRSQIRDGAQIENLLTTARFHQGHHQRRKTTESRAVRQWQRTQLRQIDVHRCCRVPGAIRKTEMYCPREAGGLCHGAHLRSVQKDQIDGVDGGSGSASNHSADRRRIGDNRDRPIPGDLLQRFGTVPACGKLKIGDR